MNYLLILIALLEITILRSAVLASFAFDYSKWTYDDLSKAAMEMQADGNTQGALELYDKAIQAEPNNPEGYLNRGAIFELLNQSKNAIRDELKAIALAESDSKDNVRFRYLAHHNLAGIYLHNNQLAKAELEAKTALQIAPNEPSSQQTLGEIFSKTGKYSDALRLCISARDNYQKQKLPRKVEEMNVKISQLEQKQK